MKRGKRSTRTLMAGAMLVAFALRALIAPGFMPARDRPFSLEICWEDLPAGMLAQVEPAPSMPHSMHMDSMHMGSMEMQSMHMGSMRMDLPQHHHGSPSHGEHCVFAAACSVGPLPHLPLPGDFRAAPQRAAALAAIAVAVRRVRLPQPRAPPRSA